MVLAPARTASSPYGHGARAGRGTAHPALRRTEYPLALRELIAQLRQMPGVGPRSAERIALWIVQARGEQPEGIARAIMGTRATIQPCAQCGFFSTADLCEICL